MCIGKLAAVLDGSVFCGFHGCTAWLAISAAWVKDLRSRVAWLLVIFMVIMVISGFLWLPLVFMVTRDCAWLPVVFMVIMVISGYQWFSMVTTGFYGYLRLCMGLPVFFLVIMVISGFLWLPPVFYGYQRLCMVTSGFYGYHGYQWFSVVFYGYHWFL